MQDTREVAMRLKGGDKKMEPNLGQCERLVAKKDSCTGLRIEKMEAEYIKFWSFQGKWM